MSFHDSSKSLSPAQVAHLLERLIYKQVCAHIDLAALGDLEEQLAIELGRLGEVTDNQMLELSRAAIGGALRQLAGDRECIQQYDECQARTRYLNALCREVDSEAKSSVAG